MPFKDDYGLLSIKDGRGKEITGYIKHPFIDEIVLCTCIFVTWMEDEKQACDHVMTCLRVMSDAVKTKLKLAEPKQSIDEVLAEIEEIRKLRESKPYQDS